MCKRASEARRLAGVERRRAATLAAAAQKRLECASLQEKLAQALEEAAELEEAAASFAQNGGALASLATGRRDTGVRAHAPAAAAVRRSHMPHMPSEMIREVSLRLLARMVRRRAEEARDEAAKDEALARKKKACARCCHQDAQARSVREITEALDAVARKKRAWAECCDHAVGALQEAADMWNADSTSLAPPLCRRRTALATTVTEGMPALSPLAISQPHWRYMGAYAKMVARAFEVPELEEND